jgi:asparagine synthase (glutamine-hydrolysing)
VPYLAERYYRPSPLEVMVGWVPGVEPPPLVSGGKDDALAALAEVLLQYLEPGPCYVAFSGGRDSSAVLAVATSVARRHGLPDPIPVTQVYPGIPEVDETEWQAGVVEHLGLTDWHRFEVRDTIDLLGPGAQDSLRHRGLVWPATVHLKVPLIEPLSGGSLLTGEGGDEVFGPRRAAPWPHLRKGTSVRRSRAASAALLSLLPRAARRQRAMRASQRVELLPWLRPAVAGKAMRLMAEDDASEPLRWDQSLLWLCSRRASIVSFQNLSGLAAEYGVRMANPLLEPAFLGALGRQVGRWGYTGRTAAMTALFGHLLPTAVVERRTKAAFNRAFLGEATSEFARRWDGAGVDPEMVDIERLRREWMSERPSALSGPLLHAAWLATEEALTPEVPAT